MMPKDRLVIFNRTLAADLQRMSDEEIWSFAQANEARIEEWLKRHKDFETTFFYTFNRGKERYREFFLSEMDEYRELVIYTMILDFCMCDYRIDLGYWASTGYYDYPGSCAVETSTEIMPSMEEIDEEFYWMHKQIYFHLLENDQLLNIIRTMQENIDKLTLNEPEDICRIERIRRFCELNQDYRTVYIYDIYSTDGLFNRKRGLEEN